MRFIKTTGFTNFRNKYEEVMFYPKIDDLSDPYISENSNFFEVSFRGDTGT